MTSSIHYIDLDDGDTNDRSARLLDQPMTEINKRRRMSRALMVCLVVTILALAITVAILAIHLRSTAAVNDASWSSTGSSLLYSSSSWFSLSSTPSSGSMTSSEVSSTSSSSSATIVLSSSSSSGSSSFFPSSSSASSSSSSLISSAVSSSVFPSVTSSSSSSLVVPVIPYPIPLSTNRLLELGNQLDSTRDITVSPCDDFLQYACGQWLNNTVLPPSVGRIVKGVQDADAVNYAAMDSVLLEKWPVINPLYQSCMNVTRIEELGLKPIQFYLDALNPLNATVNDTSTMWSWLGRLQADLSLSLAFTFTTVTFANNPRQPVLSLAIGGGWTVPGIANYIGVANISSTIKTGIANLLQDVGDDADWARKQAELIVGFETDMYRVTTQSYTLSNDQQHLLTVEQLMQLVSTIDAPFAGTYPLSSVQGFMPTVPLTPFFTATGTLAAFQSASKTVTMCIYVENVLRQFNTLISRTPLTTLLAWSRWHVLNSSSSLLSVSVRQSYLRSILTPVLGITALVDRHSLCRDIVVTNTADLFFRYFMQKLLVPSNQLASIETLFDWLKAAFIDNLRNVEWLDDSTRKGAAEKISLLLQLLGGPTNDTWSDWSNVDLSSSHLFDNYVKLQKIRNTKFWQYYLQVVPKESFTQNPFIVNAWYTRTANSIQLPTGIMHWPWWSVDQPMYMNLARLGMLVAHEMTHGFDPNGRLYDGEGNQRNWWSTGSANNFTARAQCFANQYSNITVQNSTISGTLTLSENISDGGGIHLAWLTNRWYTNQMSGFGLSPQLIPSPRLQSPLTVDQLFFWSYAQNWCTVATDEYVANEVRTNAHTPAMVRVWAPLRNFAPFAEAFNCPVGSRMNPPQADQCVLY